MINRWIGYNEGGNETHMKDLLMQFSRAGHEMSVITTRGDSLNYLMPQIKVYFINSSQGYYSYSFLGIFNAVSFNVKCFAKFLSLYLQGYRYDILSIHFSLEGILARFIKLFFGIPYVFVLAGDTHLELIEAKRADGKIQISRFMNEQCLKYGYSAEIIPKGIDLERFKPLENLTIEKDPANNIKKHVLTVCRLDPRKNLITFIEAANIIVNKLCREDIDFTVVGEGIERELLESKIKEYHLESNVSLVGMVPNNSLELINYYAGADLFVLPTLYEGFGWVYLEAMASGVPIVTTNVGSNKEVVGDVGVLIEPRDPDKLSHEILRVLDDPQLHRELRAKGLIKSQSYSWPIIFPKYESYYKKVCLSTCGVLCRFLVFVYIVVDFWRILIVLIKYRMILNFSPLKKGWLGNGQYGNQ